MKNSIIAAAILIFSSFSLFGRAHLRSGDSFAEFPVIVIVGQVVEVTPFSVIIENTFKETSVVNRQIKNMIEYYNTTTTDFRAHGLANALSAVSVKNGNMRFSLYLDNLLRIFDDDVTTYLKFLPVYYMIENNFEEIRLPEKTLNELKKHDIDYYLSLPIIKDMMDNMWLAGVFTINPDSKKLVYKSARFFKTIDEMNLSEWACEYRIPDIVAAGLALTMTKSIIIGNESQWASKPKDSDSALKKGGNRFNNKRRSIEGRER